MFLSAHRYNPFKEFEKQFNPFFDDEDYFSDFFSTTRAHKQRKNSKEKQLKKKLKNLQNEENQLNHYIKQYESDLEQLKKNQELIEKQKTEILEKISKITEEKKISMKDDSSKNPSCESRVFKKVHYISDGMEIEEQYDSTNPKNCYKIIRKQGETPQVLSAEKQNGEQIQDKDNQKQQQIQIEQMEDGVEEKIELLCKMTGKNYNELKNFVVENKDLTIGQLYDKVTL